MRAPLPEKMPLMLFKLFRKQSDPGPPFGQETLASEALQRRVNAIEFQPSRGFLKDQKQPKRSVTAPDRTTFRRTNSGQQTD
jgi:hypothetical protein